MKCGGHHYWKNNLMVLGKLLNLQKHLKTYLKERNNMIDFVKKYQKQITMGLAISLLILCYFQRQELSRLRKELGIKKTVDTSMMNVDKEAKKAQDSLILK
jgi:hypothetical protein